MFTKHDPTGFKTPIDGIDMKTLSYGEKTLTTRFHLKKDALLPRHSHPHEQAGFLLSGKMLLTIGMDEWIVEPGDAWTIKGGIEHQAKILQDSVAIEVFSPVRKDYLP
ncbi:MAG: cupin domain-containing protein [Pseudomonadota bacterium]